MTENGVSTHGDSPRFTFWVRSRRLDFAVYLLSILVGFWASLAPLQQLKIQTNDLGQSFNRIILCIDTISSLLIAREHSIAPRRD